MFCRHRVVALFQGVVFDAPGNFAAALVSATSLAKVMTLGPSAVLTLAGMSTGDTAQEERAASASILATGVLSGGLFAVISEGPLVGLLARLTGGRYTDEMADSFGVFVQRTTYSGFSFLFVALTRNTQQLYDLVVHRILN